jgi:hypothetical protein
MLQMVPIVCMLVFQFSPIEFEYLVVCFFNFANPRLLLPPILLHVCFLLFVFLLFFTLWKESNLRCITLRGQSSNHANFLSIFWGAFWRLLGNEWWTLFCFSSFWVRKNLLRHQTYFLLGRYFVSNMAFACQKEKEKKRKKCVFYFFPNKVRPICLYDLSKIYLFLSLIQFNFLIKSLHET